MMRLASIGPGPTVRIAAAVDRFVGDDPGRSVAIVGDGLDIRVAADVPRPAASVMKVLQAIALARAAAEGAVDLDETVAAADLPGTRWPSVLAVLDGDTPLSLRALAGLSLCTSDNPAAHRVFGRLGADRINRVARDLGCVSTTVSVGFDDDALDHRSRTNVTTAADCLLVLRAVVADPALAWVRRAMANGLDNSRMPGLVGAPGLVVHKTGTLLGVVHDMGIVEYGGGRVLACFLTDGQDDPAAAAFGIAKVTRTVLDSLVDAHAAVAGARP